MNFQTDYIRGRPEGKYDTMNATPCGEATASPIAVWDVTTNRDLLLVAEPKQVALNGENAQFDLCIVNGSHSARTLTVAADQTWLRPAHDRIELPAEGSANLNISVSHAGRGEYGVLQFVWQESNQSFVEPILIVRSQMRQSTAPTISRQPLREPTPKSPVPTKSSWTDDWVNP